MPKLTDLEAMVLCGRTGVGKSSIVNMLIQGDIFRDKENVSEVGNDAKGVTKELVGLFTERMQVFDTCGLGELSTGSVPNEEAINKMRNYFSQSQYPLKYICYVRENRVTKEDKECFETFKKIFKGGETNFIIIVTKTEPDWTNDQTDVQSLKENFGNYPIISVNFPFHKDERYDKVDQEIRKESLRHLQNKLKELNYESIELEVLSPSQDFENKLSPFITFVPVAGTMYQLTASGVYHFSGKPNTARKRLVAGATGFVLDATGLGLLGLGRPLVGVVGVAAGAVGKGGKVIVDKLCNE